MLIQGVPVLSGSTLFINLLYRYAYGSLSSMHARFLT